jgi:hypothetical protein
VNAAITIKETIVKYRAAKNDDDGEKISEQAMEMAKIYRSHEILEKKKRMKNRFHRIEPFAGARAKAEIKHIN